MSAFLTSVGRYLFPTLAIFIVVSCAINLLRGNEKTKPLAFLINQLNSDKILLDNYEISIGRSKACDIVLGYTTVSRFHAVLTKRRGKWFVVDTNSLAGTFIGPEKVEKKAQIENGDIISFGNASFKFIENINNPDVIIDYAKHEKDQENTKKEYNYYLDFAQKDETMKLNNLEEYTLGSSKNASITLSKIGVSPIHAMISFEKNHWIIEDLNSSNGTFLNGRRIDCVMPLENNDKIKIGTNIITFKKLESREVYE
ncbi:MAG: FHA domain-containing protein [Clostridia bacterium]|nr:FHA domain-containing protein [Clostridia bacterium]